MRLFAYLSFATILPEHGRTGLAAPQSSCSLWTQQNSQMKWLECDGFEKICNTRAWKYPFEFEFETEIVNKISYIQLYIIWKIIINCGLIFFN